MGWGASSRSSLRFVSTQSTTVTAATTDADSSVQTLEELCRQANTILNSKYLTKEEAEEDAQLLLHATFYPEPITRALYGSSPIDDETLKLLHRAFLRLTSKTLSHASPLALCLAQRAHRFGLVLHLPLYQQLLIQAAAPSQDREPAVAILELAAVACQSLQVTLDEHFFSAALLELVQSNLLKDATIVLKAMKDRHDIVNLSTDLSYQLLSNLQDQLLLELGDDDDTSAATELFLTLQSALLDDDEFPNASRDMYNNNKNITLNEALDDLLEQYEDDNDDELQDIGDAEIMDDIISMMNTKELSFAQVKAAMEEYLLQKDNNDDYPGDETTLAMTLPNPLFNSDATNHSPSVMKDVIYIRDASTWRLPDVTDQLIQLNNQEDIFYSRDYEAVLLHEMMDNDYDDDD